MCVIGRTVIGTTVIGTCAAAFRLAYPTPPGFAAADYPEVNARIPLDSTAMQSPLGQRTTTRAPSSSPELTSETPLTPGT